MAGTYGGPMSLKDLKAAVRSETDTVDDPHITDDELKLWLNSGRFALYDLLVTRFGDDYYTAKAQITLDGTKDEVPLPDGTLYSAAPAFYKGLLVEAKGLAPNQWVTLRQFNLAEKNKYALLPQALTLPYTYPRYRLHGANLMFAPMPNPGLTVQLRYAPKLLTLDAEDDVAEDWSGWLEFAILEACIRVAMKQERDASGFANRKNEKRVEIDRAATNRNPGDPTTVTETGYDDPFGFPSGPGGFNSPWGF